MAFLIPSLLILSLWARFTNAGEWCTDPSSVHYCSDCCCDRYTYGCCTCALQAWVVAVIVISIIAIIAIAVGVGVWRRRVYLNHRHTVITTSVPAQNTIVTSQQAGQVAYAPQGYPPQGYPPQGYPPQGYPLQGYPPNYSPPEYPLGDVKPPPTNAAY